MKHKPQSRSLVGRAATLAAFPALLVLACTFSGVAISSKEFEDSTGPGRRLAAETPAVAVSLLQPRGEPLELVLPGELAPIESAGIRAHVSGYVASRLVDVGSHVKPGDTLLRISAPDLDERLAQATASLVERRSEVVQAEAQMRQASANNDLADVTDSRTKRLVKNGWVSEQSADQTRLTLAARGADLETARAGVALAKARLETQQAVVGQLRELVSYETVVAPFEGHVAARTIEKGDLVSDGSAAAPLLTVVRDSVLRVRVEVPQTYVAGVRDGVKATVRLPERPDMLIDGTVTRNARALDDSRRSLLVEIDVDNGRGTLIAGDFVYVTLFIPRPGPALVVPSSSLVYDVRGLQVATVDAENRVSFKKVTVARDFGTTIEIASGLNPGERFILNPPSSLAEGAKVSPRDK